MAFQDPSDFIKALAEMTPEELAEMFPGVDWSTSSLSNVDTQPTDDTSIVEV